MGVGRGEGARSSESDPRQYMLDSPEQRRQDQGGEEARADAGPHEREQVYAVEPAPQRPRAGKGNPRHAPRQLTYGKTSCARVGGWLEASGAGPRASWGRGATGVQRSTVEDFGETSQECGSLDPAHARLLDRAPNATTPAPCTS
jgi:hypothetical protein